MRCAAALLTNPDVMLWRGRTSSRKGQTINAVGQPSRRRTPARVGALGRGGARSRPLCVCERAGESVCDGVPAGPHQAEEPARAYHDDLRTRRVRQPAALFSCPGGSAGPAAYLWLGLQLPDCGEAVPRAGQAQPHRHLRAWAGRRASGTIHRAPRGGAIPATLAVRSCGLERCAAAAGAAEPLGGYSQVYFGLGASIEMSHTRLTEARKVPQPPQWSSRNGPKWEQA
jgi:hypothetical protein